MMERNALIATQKQMNQTDVDKNAGSNIGGVHTLEEKVQPEPNKEAMLKKCSG